MRPGSPHGLVPVWLLIVHTTRGGRKATPEITVAQVRAGIAELLYEAFAGNYHRAIELRLKRTALARHYHWKQLGLLAPLEGPA